MVKITVERHARNILHACNKAAQQRRLVRVDGIDTGLVQKIERRVEARDAVAVERTGFETRRHLLGLRFGICLHTCAADLPRRDVHALAHAQSSRSLRAHERLVPCEAQHVDVHFLHVDRQNARALRGIHDKQKPMLVRKCTDARKVQHIARQVRGVRADDGAGLRL